MGYARPAHGHILPHASASPWDERQLKVHDQAACAVTAEDYRHQAQQQVQQRKAQHQSRPRVARLSTAGGFFRLLTVMARIEHRGVGDPGGYPYRPHPRKKREAIGVL